MLNYTLKVVAVKNETDDTVTISFKQPSLKKIKYRSGQYLTVIFRINGRRYLRPYSFSSAQGIDDTLNITIKRMYGGIVSNHIIDKVKVGDLIEALPPMGSFTLPDIDISDKHLVLWGCGSGITPLISIAKYALHNQLCEHITLVYGNRSNKTTIFSADIEQLKQRYSEKFSVWHFYSSDDLAISGRYITRGRIAPEKVMEVLMNEGDATKALHYICGPSGLKESIKSILKDIGVTAESIFIEEFETVKNPDDFKNIITQNVSIKKGGELSTFEVAKGKSILEAALDSMLELEYSCQTGDCLLCKARLLKGEVKMLDAKNAFRVEVNECLLCCSFPLTSDIEIVIE